MTDKLSDEIRLKLDELIDHFVVRGLQPPDVMAKMQTELINIRSAFEYDPDPADDPEEIDEPSNDWPAA
ncbi:hypothetical protein [Rhizobium sp. RM]|uniref:hypothetical protein n=1 Tax=Rhizobium sp. RM TaxID=2748079 RepID=UPI00110E9F12|nr:hypothetical protein [Rhizobium sp. RM]NWJ27476.1 hypothetical protein [Rhizobium sp. RM]TMV18623.1 hypothetical protein BJG94_15185 [Rhizobium sp. Td3]